MEFYAHHGCFEEERKVGTWFQVDLEMMVDTANAEKATISTKRSTMPRCISP